MGNDCVAFDGWMKVKYLFWSEILLTRSIKSAGIDLPVETTKDRLSTFHQEAARPILAGIR